MSKVEMLSAKIYKRRDPKKAILIVALLMILSFGVCLFIPKQWITETVFFCNVMLASVYGASVFFFAQERKRWKAVATVLFAAAAMLEIFVCVRFSCGYDIFLVGKPSVSIPVLLSDYSVALDVIRVAFYRLLLLFAMVAFSYMRFSGRKQWWGVVVPASITVLICNVVYIAPKIAEPGADIAIVNQLAAQLLEQIVFAAVIFSTAVLLEWISSFNSKPLHLKMGAALWTALGMVVYCAAAAFLTMMFVETLTGAEYILCTVIGAASFLALLLRKRAGISTAFFAAALGIAASLGTLIGTGDESFLFISLGCVLLPAMTWLILGGSWQNNAVIKNQQAGQTQTGDIINSPTLVLPAIKTPDAVSASGEITASINTAAVEPGKKESKKTKKQKLKEEKQREEKQKQSDNQIIDNAAQLDTVVFERIKAAETREISPNGFCGYCGAVFEADARFCKICGKSRIQVDPTIPVEIAQIHAESINKAYQAPQNAEAKKIYVASDNRGTMHKDVGQATSYWVMRRPAMQKKPPYLLYVFRTAKAAKQALLDISYIHTAADTGGLICDYLMEYGFYEVANDNETVCYEAVICGHDLTVERYNEAKASFEKHKGMLKTEQAPDPKYLIPQGVADINAITLKEEFVDNGRYTYRVHYAPNRATAIEFLRQSRVDREYFYLVIETPEGSYGRDIDGMYEV